MSEPAKIGETGMIVETGPARFRNHVRQNIRFLCRGDFEKLEREIKEERRKALEQIEKECHDRRTKLKRSLGQLERQHSALSEKIQGKKIELTNLEQRLFQKRVSEDLPFWPKVPTENKRAIELRGENMPATSGIYFLWDNTKDIVVYVGQSINLRNRVRSGHDKLPQIQSPTVSFLEFPVEELIFAESFYIGVLKPVLNGATQSRVYCSTCHKRRGFCKCGDAARAFAVERFDGQVIRCMHNAQ
jgi:hypothetical protein